MNFLHTISRIAILGLLTSVLSGCFTVGQEFAASRVGNIKIGQTRKQDISELFGSPWRTGSEDGQQTWAYGIYKYDIFGGNESEDLLVRFDNQGIVRAYTFNTTRK
jgi:outer membrane protein assembly factor BamE (lipoprotein component of BamABCDE complex)